jgi:hypothetical protein
MSRYREANKDRIRKQNQEWFAKNKSEILKRRRVYQTDYWRRKRGLPLPTRPRPELCELCGARKATDLDHDHLTGKFRGWLCGRCNRGLGLLGDHLHVVVAALVYLIQAD